MLSPIPEHLESNRVHGARVRVQWVRVRVLKISTRVGLEYTAGLEYYITDHVKTIPATIMQPSLRIASKIPKEESGVDK